MNDPLSAARGDAKPPVELGARSANLLPQARLAGPVPWVIAIMIALMTVAACGGVALSNIASAARAELAGGLTVQILEASPVERDRQAALALAALRAAPGVRKAHRVPDAQLQKLVSPWLGDVEAGNAIPMPALLDVSLAAPATPARLSQLKQRLALAAPAAKVSAQSSWLAPVFSALASLQWLAICLVLLLAAATIAGVWLAARTALGANRETIEIVHHLGGTDDQIARIFQNSVAFDALLGSSAGLVVGLVVAHAIGARFVALESGMIAGARLQGMDWALVGLVPVAGVLLAMATARVTVLVALRRML